MKEYYREYESHFQDDIMDYDDNNQVNNVVAHTNDNHKVCFWVTGHSMGGGVANLVSAGLINGKCNGNSNNVYSYTFAAPNTFYRTDNDKDNYREPHGTKYRCIFNIVNDDDFVPKLPMEECEWTKYGRVAKKSIEKELYSRYINDVKHFNYESTHHSNSSEASYTYDMTKISYMKYVVRDYNSNKFAVDSAILLLKGVYDYQHSAFGDKNHMRNETYSYNSRMTHSGNAIYSHNEINKLNEEISYMNIQTLDDFVFEYSRPYQKNDKNFFGYSQKQTPAFLMQSIASAMHTLIKVDGEIREQGEENAILGFKIKDNQYRFIKTKMAYSGIGAKWSILLSGGPLNALETPHYLESYYTLTKELSTVDFR